MTPARLMVLLSVIAALFCVPPLALAQTVSPAHAVLDRVLGGAGSSATFVEGPAPGDPGYPFSGSGGYLSQSSVPDLGLTVEVFATPQDRASRRASLLQVAPDDVYATGSYGGGSVLLHVSSAVSPDVAAAYQKNLAVAMLILQ